MAVRANKKALVVLLIVVFAIAAGAHVIGAVLNRVRSRRGEYYYYHRYYPTKA